MDGQKWLDQIQKSYSKYKIHCEKAAEQVSDKDFFSTFGGNPQSIASLMKHIGGNHRSRWREFLTTDGEKPDRNRDSEFIIDGEIRTSIYEKWEEGWLIAFETLESLTETDLDKTISIRGEPLGVVEAIIHNLNHVAYHTGQIVQLARQFAGESWKTLSIAVGKSEDYSSRMRAKYGDWWEKKDDIN